MPIRARLKTRLHKNIVGPYVRRLRTDRGWSQPDFAAECQRNGWDVDRDTIAKIEGRSRKVSDYEVAILARIFGKPLDWLLPSGGKAADISREFTKDSTK